MSFWFGVLEGLGLEVVLVGLAGFIAFRVGCALLPDASDALERLAVAGMVALVGWVALLQILGLIGVLWLPVVIAALALLAGASLRFLPSPAPLRRGVSRVPWGVVAAAVPFVVLAVVEVLWSPPGPNSYDSLHYQIGNAAHLLDGGSIRGLPFAQPGENTGTEPGNGSLLLLAVMLPFHNASLVSLPNLLCAGLLIAVSAMLARELGGTAWAGVAGGLVAVTTVCFFETQIRSAYVDAVSLLGLMSAMTFGLRSARTGRRAALLLSGLSLGLAIGAKEAYLPPGVVVAAAVLWAHRARLGPRSALGFIAAAGCLSLSWYVRNWVVAGDPIFPQTVQLGSTVVFAGLRGSAAAFAGHDQSLVAALIGGGAAAAGWPGFAVVNFGASLVALLACPVLAARCRGRVRLVALTACGCAITYALTPFTGSSVGTQLNAEMRFLLPAVALATVTLAAALPGYWCRLGAVAALAANAVFLAVVESRDGFLGLPIPLVAAAGVAGVAAALRWRGALTRAARAPTVRRAAVLALAVLSVLATAHLQPSSAGTPLARALQGAGNPGGPVVVMDVGDVAVLLGPRLDVDVVAAGEGPVGAERPLRSAGQLSRRIEALHPAAVVVGSGLAFNVVPGGWSPPSSWRRLGSEDGAIVYEP